MTQDVTIRMPDGTTRKISETHEPKTSTVTTPAGKKIELVEWVPKGEGLEKARHDSASWDEISAPTPAADRLAGLNAELLSLLRRARQLQRAQFQNIQVRRDAAAFGRNERELEGEIWPRVNEIRAALRAAELADDAERGLQA